MESSIASGCSPFRMGADYKERCVASHAFGYESAIAAREGLWFWTNLTQVS